MKMKKLNRKGFTLIELLAVIVILAVVMGVAANSVLSAMNNSRLSSLQNSASSAADSFRTAYAENILTNSGTVLGLTIKNNEAVQLTADSFAKLNITAKNYIVGGVNGTGNSQTYTGSFLWINSDGTVVVCLAAEPTGSYFVTGKATNVDTGISSAKKYKSGVMFACSNGKNSWT